MKQSIVIEVDDVNAGDGLTKHIAVRREGGAEEIMFGSYMPKADVTPEHRGPIWINGVKFWIQYEKARGE